MKESTKLRDSSKRFGRNQQSNPKIHMNRNNNPRHVMRKKINNRKDADKYHAKTFKKFGQMGKQTQQKNPTISSVVKK